MGHDLPEEIDYLYIKYCLAKKGYSLKKVADDLGLSGSQCIHQVLIRKYISARVEKRVSEIIGIPLEQLFPDRYQSSKYTRKQKIDKSPKNFA